MLTALDRRVAYYGTHLSENIIETPEGYLLCKNAVIGRTGFQTYKVSELADPDGLLSERYGPDEPVDVWRDPSEVFRAATIASFEGKTFTLTHPEELLTPENDNRHNQGHVANVRRGTEPLENGNIPMLADIIVKGREAIDAIKSGARELSCGYTYKLVREGYRWDQRDILGNHVALVQKARAGDEARINDSAPIEPARRETVKNYLKHFVGLGFQMFSKDAKPEEVTEALQDPEIREAITGSTDGKRVVAADKKPEDNVIVISDGKKEEKMVFVGKTSDGTEIFKRVVGADAVAAATAAEKERAAVSDARKALHSKFDTILDGFLTSKGTDADVDELKTNIAKFLGDEAPEQLKKEEKKAADTSGHPEGCMCKDCQDKRAGKDKETEKELIEEDEAAIAARKEEEREEHEAGDDDAEVVRAEPVLEAKQAPESVLKDAAILRVLIADANLSMLNVLKPIVAKSGDKKLKAAFDQLTTGLRRVVKEGNGQGSYAEFMAATKVLNKTAKDSKTGKDNDWKPRESEIERTTREANEIYANVMKTRGRPFSARMAAAAGK